MARKYLSGSTDIATNSEPHSARDAVTFLYYFKVGLPIIGFIEAIIFIGFIFLSISAVIAGFISLFMGIFIVNRNQNQRVEWLTGMGWIVTRILVVLVNPLSGFYVPDFTNYIIIFIYATLGGCGFLARSATRIEPRQTTTTFTDESSIRDNPLDTESASEAVTSGRKSGRSSSGESSPSNTDETDLQQNRDCGSHATQNESTPWRPQKSNPKPDLENKDETDSISNPTTEADHVAEYRNQLTAQKPATRCAAINGLREASEADEISTTALVDALAERVEDDDPEVRLTACEALGEVEHERADSLIKSLRLDPDSEVSRTASRVLSTSE